MFDIQREELDWCGRKLTLETGRVARQADGAVLATWGETTVLATVVAAKEPKPGQDFFPLTVHYQEKAFAAGRIPGGYLKREGRLSDRETLTSRLIDRPIRPLFPDDFRCDTQVIATVFSYDLETDSDILAMIASSAALTLSGVPFMGPIGAARVGVIKGDIRVNATVEEMKDFHPRSCRRRHGGRGANGRVGGQGALRGDDAKGGDGRPCLIPAGPSGDYPTGREGRQGAARTRNEGSLGGRKGSPGSGRGRPSRRLFPHPETGALRRPRRRQGEGVFRARARGRRGEVSGRRGCEGFPRRPGQGRALEHSRPQAPHRRAGSDHRASDPGRGRGAAPHPWLRFVHARRNAGDRRRHARHGRGRAICRFAGRDLQGAVPAPLQLSPLFGRRNRPYGSARPARNRTRQARLARHSPDAADPGRIPLHDPRRLGDHRVRTAHRPWRQCADRRWR